MGRSARLYIDFGLAAFGMFVFVMLLPVSSAAIASSELLSTAITFISVGATGAVLLANWRRTHRPGVSTLVESTPSAQGSGISARAA